MNAPISARSSRDCGGVQRIGGVTQPSCQAVLGTVTATRYVTPRREGGSLPAIVEADDDGLYVCKFRGAGQGTKALAAEIVAGGVGGGAGRPGAEPPLVAVGAAAPPTRP